MTDKHTPLGGIREAIEIATSRMPWSSENFATIMTAIVLDAPLLVAEIERSRQERGDLLAALEEIASGPCCQSGGDFDNPCRDTMTARAAIAKARGLTND